MSNETHTMYHTVHLDVIDKAPDSPKTMYISTDHWMEEGHENRLFCEFLVGPSYLADAKNEVRWRKVWPNSTEGELLSSQTEIRTTREDNQYILGSYLIFPEISSVDYGTYVCTVQYNEIISKRYVTLHYKAGVISLDGSMSEVPWRTFLLFSVFSAASLVTMYVLHKKFTPRLLLSLRLMHARATQSAQRNRVLEKEFDVAVSFVGVDGALVHGALLNTLSVKYNYRVLPVCLSSPDHWYGELVDSVQKCRSLVCVVSPRQYTPAQLLIALRQLRALPMQPVLVLLQDLPKLKHEPKDANGESLVSALRNMRPIAWRHLHDRAFWTALRLALPLPPLPMENRGSSEPKKSITGSLDALV